MSAVRTRAVPEGDHYRLHGTKIFITWGEHDMAENIVHLVLARTPDAPEGVKGISLFIVPKFLVNDDGSLGVRNDVKCVSIEHKMGINASPTCVLAYGDGKGALGYLVGEENRGLEYMFIMMNHARLGVGLEGVALAERAYQHAREYAKTRVQGRAIGQKSGDRVTIIHHPDVKRMLLTMKAQTEAMRALAYSASAALDKANHHPDERERRTHQALVDFLIPIVKGWCTEQGVEIASVGVQIHGGMGFIEETGAAQYLRDARITTIYEGTTGIQAADLVGRKVGFEKGATAFAIIEVMRKTRRQARRQPQSGRARGARKSFARDRRPRGRHAMGRRYLPARSPGGSSSIGAISQVMGHGRRRMADGARGADRGRETRHRWRHGFLSRQDRNCAILCGAYSAAGRRSDKRGYGRIVERARADRSAVLAAAFPQRRNTSGASLSGCMFLHPIHPCADVETLRHLSRVTPV